MYEYAYIEVRALVEISMSFDANLDLQVSSLRADVWISRIERVDAAACGLCLRLSVSMSVEVKDDTERKTKTMSVSKDQVTSAPLVISY